MFLRIWRNAWEVWLFQLKLFRILPGEENARTAAAGCWSGRGTGSWAGRGTSGGWALPAGLPSLTSNEDVVLASIYIRVVAGGVHVSRAARAQALRVARRGRACCVPPLVPSQSTWELPSWWRTLRCAHLIQEIVV